MASPSGLWTSVSGGMAQSQQIEVIANNIANSNTTGFKKDEVAFKEYLSAVERPPSPVVDIPRTAFKDSDFYHHEGRENALVNVDEIRTNFTQGQFKMTGAPFDMSIDGPGFFPVLTPQGLLYTRAGDFKPNAQGQLVTPEGYPLMGLSAEGTEAVENALQARAQAEEELRQLQEQQPQAAAPPLPPLPNPFAAVGERAPAQAGALPPPPGPVLQPLAVASTGQKITISSRGRIYNGDALLGSVVVAEFPQLKGLRKVGTNLYENADASNVAEPGRQSRLMQGYLEGSNVNTVSELVNLIKANRGFEGSMRAIKVYNDMAGKEANEVGKL